MQSFLNNLNNLDDRMREKSLKRFLENVSGKSVLDVGAGAGVWTKYWLSKGAQVTAIEHNPALAEGIKQLYPTVTCINCDISTAILGRYDVIFAKDIIEHIKDDARFFDSMRKALNPNGVLILITQNSLSLNYLIEGGYQFLCGNSGWLGYDPEHLRFYDCRKLKAKLTQAGLKPVRWWGSYHVPYRFINSLLFKRLFEWRGYHFVDVLNLNSVFPFNVTGWSLGVIVKKEDK